MAQTFRKYELTPTQWATARKKIEKTGTDPEGETYTYWNPDLVAVLVDLGKLCQEWGTDAEGNQVCIKQNTKVSIDIVWVGEPLADFNAYEVLPLPVGVSSMGYTLDQEYAKHFCEVNPTHEYCLPPTPPELV
jgi:hypothetical protein